MSSLNVKDENIYISTYCEKLLYEYIYDYKYNYDIDLSYKFIPYFQPKI